MTLYVGRTDELEHDHEYEEVMGRVQRARDSLFKLAAKIGTAKSQHWAALKEKEHILRAATADLGKPADSFAKEHVAKVSSG